MEQEILEGVLNYINSRVELLETYRNATEDSMFDDSKSHGDFLRNLLQVSAYEGELEGLNSLKNLIEFKMKPKEITEDA